MRRQIREQKVICCTVLTKMWPYQKQELWGEYPTPMLMLPFPKNANRYALCPVAMQLKSEKTGMRRTLSRCWDREQVGRFAGKKEKRTIQKHRRYARKIRKTPRNSSRFVEVELKGKPNTSGDAEERRRAIQNASRYAEEERSTIPNTSRYAEKERNAIRNTSRYAEKEEEKKGSECCKNPKTPVVCTGPRYAENWNRYTEK